MGRFLGPESGPYGKLVGLKGGSTPGFGMVYSEVSGGSNHSRLAA
jgi:hypothetical protein